MRKLNTLDGTSKCMVVTGAKVGNCLKHAVGIKNLVLGHHALVVDIIRAVDGLPIFNPSKVGLRRKLLEWTCTHPFKRLCVGPGFR